MNSSRRFPIRVQFDRDADLRFADWTKKTWDFPFEYGSEEFYEWLRRSGMTLAEFKKLPCYYLALESGSISEPEEKGGKKSRISQESATTNLLQQAKDLLDDNRSQK